MSKHATAELARDKELQVNDNQIIGSLNSIFPPLTISKRKRPGNEVEASCEDHSLLL